MLLVTHATEPLIRRDIFFHNPSMPYIRQFNRSRLWLHNYLVIMYARVMGVEYLTISIHQTKQLPIPQRYGRGL